MIEADGRRADEAHPGTFQQRGPDPRHRAHQQDVRVADLPRCHAASRQQGHLAQRGKRLGSFVAHVLVLVPGTPPPPSIAVVWGVGILGEIPGDSQCRVDNLQPGRQVALTVGAETQADREEKAGQNEGACSLHGVTLCAPG